MGIPYYAKDTFMQFSLLERQSLYQLMCGVMLVDKDVDSREKQAIAEISQAMRLTQRDIIESRNLSLDSMKSVLRRMPDEKRFLVARAISTIAMADGKVLPIEDAFARHLAKELNLDLSWF